MAWKRATKHMLQSPLRAACQTSSRPLRSPAVPWTCRRCLSTATQNGDTPPPSSNPFQDMIDAAEDGRPKGKPVSSGKQFRESRSQFVTERVHELKEAGHLKYPRLNSTKMPIPLNVWVKRYIAASPDASEGALNTIAGRIDRVRRMGSYLVFFHISSDDTMVQVMCSLKKIKGEVTATEETVMATSNPEGLAAEGLDAEGLAAESTARDVILPDVELEPPKPATGDMDVKWQKIMGVLRRGDYVSVTGVAGRNKSGELVLEARMLPRILTPNITPLPQKLDTPEAKVQYRHIELLTNKRAYDILDCRSLIITWMREYFSKQRFREFSTPILAANAGGALAQPFVTSLNSAREQQLALRIAPELWLKKLVVSGFERVYEIGPAFRNEGLDATHNPEFTMCEFYIAHKNLEGIMNMTKDMFTNIAERLQPLIGTRFLALPQFNPAIADRTMWREIQFIPGLENAMGFDMPDLEAPNARDKLLSLLEERNIDIGPTKDVSLPKILDRLAARYLESKSIEGIPVFITHHPAIMSPLAKSFKMRRRPRHNPSAGWRTTHVAARAELFIGGREVANMYEEENDPLMQRRKFMAQAARRAEDPSGEDGSTVVDESFLAALDTGLPPTAGWGCGVERLVMLFTGAKRIGDCMPFGTLSNIVGLAAPGREWH